MEQTLKILTRSTPSLSTPTTPDRTCPICHKEIKPVPVKWHDGTIKLCPVACQCEIDEFDANQRRQEENLRKRKIEKQFSIAAVGKTLAEASFENFEQTPGSQTAYREAIEFVNNFEKRDNDGEGLLLYGKPGGGKSHLSVAITREIVKKGRLVVYQSVPEFLRRMKQGFGENATGLLEAITLADLVVLDDIGSGAWTKIERGYFEDIMETLNFHKKLLVATTNLNPADEETSRALLGERSFDRLIGLCRVVENKAWSYRRKMAVERAKEATR